MKWKTKGKPIYRELLYRRNNYTNLYSQKLCRLDTNCNLRFRDIKPDIQGPSSILDVQAKS